MTYWGTYLGKPTGETYGFPEPIPYRTKRTENRPLRYM